MTQQEIIIKINTSKTPKQLFGDLTTWKTQYKQFQVQIHTDKCSLPGVEDAVRKLNEFKVDLEKGKKFKDDAGVVTYKLFSGEIIGDKALLKKSVENYNYLVSLKDPNSLFFRKFLPLTYKLISDNEIEFTFYEGDRGVPLNSLENLEGKHVAWITNRMLEFSSYLNKIGIVHGGLNPDSIFILPDVHGMVPISFYHMQRIGAKMKTISSVYKSFYPQDLFTHKTATSNIDVECSKRTAIYLRGDKSGIGNKLRKTVNLDILNFLQKPSDDPFQSLDEHRIILEKNFGPKRFHVLDI